MSDTLPADPIEFQAWPWSQIEPHYRELAERPLTTGNVNAWMADWSRLYSLVDETRWRLYAAHTLDTADAGREQAYHHFLESVYAPAEAAEQRLKQKLLKSGLRPERFDLPLRRLQAEADLFREANLPLLTEDRKLGSEYEKISGAQTVLWDGREITLPQLLPMRQDPDRAVREKAWRAAAERQLADQGAINDLWARFMDVRGRLARNAGRADFRAYRWQQLLRFDYSPEDCARFHRAIEEAVVPAVRRLYEKRRRQLGVDRLRPWDLEGDPLGRPPLRPYHTAAELEEKGAAIFRRVDPALGDRFDRMRREGMLDLENRKGKGPGAYCVPFSASKRPFVFMNAVGLHDDVQTLLHECGHAFHAFEEFSLPFAQQYCINQEFSEVASMAMELLAAPYFTEAEGGFYSPADAARARVEHLEAAIRFWPYMAVVDAFQHWVYEHHDEARRAENCDAAWDALWERFMPGVDWSGLEDVRRTGWQRKLHIHTDPFYYVEYGLAQLGAVQVWRNALKDQAGAVARYRQALALGGTVSIPELYIAAGAKFALDAATLGEAVALMENSAADD